VITLNAITPLAIRGRTCPTRRRFADARVESGAGPSSRPRV